MRRIILVDHGCLMFRGIFSWVNRKEIPATFTYMSMLLGNLKRIKVTPEDSVIIAVDSPKGSWRRNLDANYKANRKEAREKNKEINWKFMFDSFARLRNDIKLGTPFQQIEIEKLEADDIIAYACRYYKDNQCIIISSDSDYEQLYCFDNVKVFSPISKKFKKVPYPERILAKKIEKERSDNLITPILTKADYNIRYTIVNLLQLPDFVEEQIKKELDNIREKIYNINEMPYKVIKERFIKMYGG